MSRTIIVSALLLSMLCWAVIPRSVLADCSEGRRLYVESWNQKGLKQKQTLLKSIRACPKLAQAHNNLGLWYENQGDLNKAAKHYQTAIKLDNFLYAPLAGLGDIACNQGRLPEAVNYYEEFLSALNRICSPRDPNSICAYKTKYSKRLSEARAQLGIHNMASTGVVSREVLRGSFLSYYDPAKPHPDQGTKIRPRISLPSVQFEFDSAQLTDRGMAQLDEVAFVLNSKGLENINVLIEGHTDTLGSSQYNYRLSLARAEAVRIYLLNLGIKANRMRPRGLGESVPIIPAGDKQQQAQNRRVVFVQEIE